MTFGGVDEELAVRILNVNTRWRRVVSWAPSAALSWVGG
jgi:hypothetical protein